MEISTMHLVSILCTILASISLAIYSARGIKSAAGFSLAGRTASARLVAGGIAGVIIGGGATVGTAQLAFQVGLSAWAYALGAGIAFLIMGLFYARPLRTTGLETVPQFFNLHYGKWAGIMVSVAAMLSMLISQVPGTIAAVQIIMQVLGITPEIAVTLFTMLVIATVFFSGQKGNSVSGIVKMCILWGALLLGGIMAASSLSSMPSATFNANFPAHPWFNLFGRGVDVVLGNIFSMVVGILCAQAYIQALYSATDARTAAHGAFTASAVIIPIGIPIVAIGMFMKANHPTIKPILALPTYFLTYFPDWLGGIAIAGILLAIIGSTAGMALGIGTLLSRDFVANVFNVTSNDRLILANRITICATMVLGSWVSYINLNATILEWNFMSMILRGAGVFVPLTLAIFMPGWLPPKWAVASIVIATAVPIISQLVLKLSINPLFLALGVSAAIIITGIMVSGKDYRNKFKSDKDLQKSMDDAV